jgi:hypothetical protein
VSLHDEHGNPYSSANTDALDHWQTAVAAYLTYNDDPFPLVDEALAVDPDFVMGHCFHAVGNLSGTDGRSLPEVARRLEILNGLASRANDRERGHIAAVNAWYGGEWEKARDCWGHILDAYPRDGFALHVVHTLDFYLGDPRILRDRIARVLPFWDATVPGHSHVVAMHAFGLEEDGNYPRAEERALYAYDCDRRDAWAVHTVAHVYEMEGRVHDGIAWLDETWDHWIDGVFAVHNAWHKCLFHLDLGEFDRALEIHDAVLFRPKSDFVQELLDCASLLWRLTLMGLDLRERWAEQAPFWQARIDDGCYAFNDMHAMMALAGAGDETGQEALLARMEATAQGEGTNAMMTRRVGLPVCRGIQAWSRGHYAQAVAALEPVRYDTHLFGGSHAQRDVIGLTLIQSAFAAGDLPAARRLVAERAERRPGSRLNQEYMELAGL